MLANYIPPNSKYIPVSIQFTALFNNPTIGVYDFGRAANQNVILLDFQQNSFYFIDAISIGGDISEPEYCNSILTMPRLALKRSLTGERVYSRDLSIPKFCENRSISAVTKSDKINDAVPGQAVTVRDQLVADLSGVLGQIITTVGKVSITLSIALSIFQIDEKGYNRIMKGIA